MKNSKGKASIPNPALKIFSALIGEWKTVGSHPYLPGIVLQGRASYNWLENGAFMIMHSENEEEKIPNGIAIFGFILNIIINVIRAKNKLKRSQVILPETKSVLT